MTADPDHAPPSSADPTGLSFTSVRFADRRLRVLAGQSGGLLAAPLRGLLALAGVGTGAVVRYRNRQFDSGKRRAIAVPIPTISVGNITTGGTGKTPLVAAIVGRLREWGYRPALVSRGYKGGARDGAGPFAPRNDEARELASQFPDVPHAQHPDRVAAARHVLAESLPHVLVLDDAFSHRRLHRDLDIVTIDATCPFGLGALLPRGLLREPMESLARADIIVVTRADLVDSATRVGIEARLREFVRPDTPIAAAVHEPARLVPIGGAGAGSAHAPTWLRDRRTLAFCGLGNPTAFERTVALCGAEVVGFRAFPDHHRYRWRDLEAIDRQARECGALALVTSAKDAAKIAPLIDARAISMPVYRLDVTMSFVTGAEIFDRFIKRAARRMPLPSTEECAALAATEARPSLEDAHTRRVGAEPITAESRGR